MARQSTFTDAENTKLRELAEVLKQRMGSQRALARALDITQPSVSAILDPRRVQGLSHQLAEKLCHLAGTDLDAYLEKPRSAFPKIKDIYANRAQAIELGRALAVDDRATEALRQVHPAPDMKGRVDDAPVIWWMTHLLNFHSLYSGVGQRGEIPAFRRKSPANATQ